MKNPVSFRLSAECVRLIKDLSNEKGISQASIVEMLVREAAKKEKIEIKK